MNPLGGAAIEGFMERGWCALRGAFSADQAAAARGAVWARMRDKRGITPEDARTWPPACDIEERLDVPEVLDCFTDGLCDAIEQLVGPGNWFGERRWGFWPVNFHFGRDEPDPFPTRGWHVDGNWFRHRVDCPKQGLLVMGLFSDVPPGSGGTVVAEGTHQRAAQVLAACPDGIDHLEFFDRVLDRPIGNFRELTGQAGDVILGHPFLFHTRGFKRHGPPRFQSNVEAPLRAPLRLRHGDVAPSVLERSVQAALAGGEVRFTAPRLCRF